MAMLSVMTLAVIACVITECSAMLGLQARDSQASHKVQYANKGLGEVCVGGRERVRCWELRIQDMAKTSAFWWQLLGWHHTQHWSDSLDGCMTAP